MLKIVVAGTAASLAFASPAAALVDLTKVSAKTFATFAPLPVKRGWAPKLALYLNQDTVRTTAMTVRTPHTVTTPAVYKTVSTPVYATSRNATTATYYKQTQVLVTPAKTVTTYTSVTTYATKITPKAQIFLTSRGSGYSAASPLFGFQYETSVAPWAQSALTGIQNANVTLSALSTSAAVIDGDAFTQAFDGSISFTRATPFVVPAHGYSPAKPLTNLLTISFTNAVLSGLLNSSTFALHVANPSGTVHYTSDFLNFINDYNDDVSLNFTAVSPNASLVQLAQTTTTGAVSGSHSLATMRAIVGGEFGASSVPEPAVWLLMVAGFGMIGLRGRGAGTVAD